MTMNPPKSHSKPRESLHIFPSPSWSNLVPTPFLIKCYVKWFYPSLCEDFDLELEVSKLSLNSYHDPKP
jgi:hypothetical protein